jgi:hypothetical protein
MNLVCVIRAGKHLSHTLASIKFSMYGESIDLPYIICHTWEEGFVEAKQSYNYGLFVDSGTVFYDIQTFIKELSNYPHQGLVGHIVDPKNADEYYWLHPQCFLLELQQFDVDNFNELHNQEVVVPARSEKNIHDDYTPLWVKNSGQIKSYDTSKFGGLLINQILQSKKLVANFSVPLRGMKQFLYTDEIKNNWIEYNKEYMKMASNQLWILNNEPIDVNFKHDKVICPGSGFYWMLAAEQAIEQIDIVDISKIQIKFVRDLLEHWNGKDYGGFVVDFMQSNSVVHYNLDKDITKLDRLKFANKDLLRRYINEHAITVNWELIKTKKINLHNENIVPYVLANQPTNTDFWISNILNYKYTLLTTVYEDIQKFQDYIKYERKT